MQGGISDRSKAVHYEEESMPLIEIKLFETRITEDAVVAEIVAAVTDGLCSVIGEAAREQTWVVVDGVSPKRWGFGGKVMP
jgi:phenylpyruvate tautomerase PptA (4-oxalocrotonate tautomerase family)